MSRQLSSHGHSSPYLCLGVLLLLLCSAGRVCLAEMPHQQERETGAATTIIEDKTPSPPVRKVSLQLIWKHQFEFAGFYAAISKGFFRDKGLDVELREYDNPKDVFDEVLSGRATYGISNGQVIEERLKGRPLTLLASYFRKVPLVFLGQPGIRTLDDLTGKRVMISDKDLKSPVIQAAFGEDGLVPGYNLTVVPHSFNDGPLIRREVDAMAAFISNEPFELERKGVPFHIIDLSGYPRRNDGHSTFVSRHPILPFRSRFLHRSTPLMSETWMP